MGNVNEKKGQKKGVIIIIGCRACNNDHSCTGTISSIANYSEFFWRSATAATATTTAEERKCSCLEYILYFITIVNVSSSFLLEPTRQQKGCHQSTDTDTEPESVSNIAAAAAATATAAAATTTAVGYETIAITSSNAAKCCKKEFSATTATTTAATTAAAAATAAAATAAAHAASSCAAAEITST